MMKVLGYCQMSRGHEEENEKTNYLCVYWCVCCTIAYLENPNSSSSTSVHYTYFFSS